MKKRVDFRGFRVTENSFLDMNRVGQFYILARNNLPLEPFTVVPNGTSSYYVNGHHRAYALFLRGIYESAVDPLESDKDVEACMRGKAKDHKQYES